MTAKAIASPRVSCIVVDVVGAMFTAQASRTRGIVILIVDMFATSELLEEASPTTTIPSYRV